MSIIIHSLVPVVSLVHISQKDLVQEGLGNKSKPNLNLMGISTYFFYVAKYNLGKVNLETMLASGLPSYVRYYAGAPMGWQGLHVLCQLSC